MTTATHAHMTGDSHGIGESKYSARRAILVLLFTLVLPLAAAVAQPAGTITTVAGGGPNNMPALSANIAFPSGVTVDSAGNVYASSGDLHRVFKVDTAGQLTVVAGNGTRGFSLSGVGGLATSASVVEPLGVAVDANGNLFIADRSSRLVFRVDSATGIITIVAGLGSIFAGDGGLAIETGLNDPWAVTLDANGNLFIAESSNFNSRVRRVDAATGIITTVAGTGVRGFNGDGIQATSARLNLPFGVAVDSSGNLFIADSNNNRIRRVDAATGIITTVAGSGTFGYSGDGGLATNARLSDPYGVALDAKGNLFIGDRLNNRVRRVDAATGIISTVAGDGTFGSGGDGGPATDANLRIPRGVAVDATGNLFIADFGSQRIRRVDAATGIITTVAGNGTTGFSGDGGPATDASLRFPQGLALHAGGSLFIADAENQRIRRVDATSGTITTAAGNGIRGFSGDGGPAADASLHLSPFPHIFRPNFIGVAVDATSNLFISDTGNQRIRRVAAATGIITTVAGNGDYGFSGDGGPATDASFQLPTGVALDTEGNLFIADSENNRIRRVDVATGIITTAAGNGLPEFSGDGGPATDASVTNPAGLVVDGSGNLFIADSGNRRVRRVDAATGTIVTVAGDGSFVFGEGVPATASGLFHPLGVALDATGNLFIADRANRRIRRVDAATGIITTVAGNGSSGFGGDGGPATEARLEVPVGVAVGSGTLFIADTNNHRIRTVILNRAPVADAGADQCVPCTTPGATQVTLDGSGSSDADEDPLTYRWTGPFPEGNGVATGVSPTVTLPLGKSTITLLVNDGKVDSAPDTVDITAKVRVVGLQAPLAPLASEGEAILMPDRAFRQKQVLPLKLELFCGATELTDADVAAPQIVALVRDGEAADLDTVDLEAGESSDTGLSFRFEDGDWVYNLSTQELSAGTYLITIQMPDGLRYTAAFVLR